MQLPAQRERAGAFDRLRHAHLHRALGPGEPVGYLRGKAKMRDALVDLHGFSQLEAESVVDTLELQGYLHFLGDPRAASEAESRWDFRTG